MKRHAREQIFKLMSPHRGDWWALEDDPSVDDLVEHVVGAGKWTNPFRPFSPEVRTNAMRKWFLDYHADIVVDLKKQAVEIE